VGTDPKPEDSALHVYAEGPVTETYASRPESTYALKVKRWMLWIFLQEAKILPRQCLGACRKDVQSFP